MRKPLIYINLRTVFLSVSILLAICILTACELAEAENDKPDILTIMSELDMNIRSEPDTNPSDESDATVSTQDSINPFVPRPNVQTCQLPAPPKLGTMNLIQASQHQFSRPLWYSYFPGQSQKSVLAEQSGKIWIWDEQQEEEPKILLDVSVSRAGNEEGLLGVAFHPNFETDQKWIFTYYSAKECVNLDFASCSILSKWQMNATNTQIDPLSEVKLLEIPQPFLNHNGGDLRFGPDGYLYVSLGDGGSARDPSNYGQSPEILLGSILRLDINIADQECRKEYSIPQDNPFTNNRCGSDESAPQPEVWAYGLRNTWRMSFDRETGLLWGADVGQDKREEVNLLQRGKNYGWKVVEGDICSQDGCDLNAYEPPVHVYGREVGESITGGFVYRGQALPALQNHYVFADFDSGRIMAFNIDQPNERITLVESSYRISSFGETVDGELRLLTFDRPSILRLEPANQDREEPFPQLLSQTGCYQNTAQDLWVDTVIPYYVNLPFWSDFADKGRAFAMPVGTQMQINEAGVGFKFPVNSVLIKTFYIDDREGNRKRFETRLMHHHQEDLWVGYTYRWHEDESDAYLLTQAEDLPIDGPQGPQVWSSLKRSDCLKCHTQASGRTLGLEVMQLNRWVSLDEGRYHQLTAWGEAGYISLPQTSENLPAFIPYDENENLDQKARSYLHVNCSPCHRPDAITTTELDLRYQTPFNQMKVCNVIPLQGTLNISDAYLLTPGRPEKSIVLERMIQRGEDQMPSIGSHVVDNSGAGIISLWISTLTDCGE